MNFRKEIGYQDALDVGVAIASDFLNLKGQVDYSLEDKSLFMSSEIVGVYLYERDLIIFNKDIIEKLGFFEIITVVIHEVRHVYQYKQIILGSKSKEPKRIIDEWTYEQSNYEVFREGSNEINTDVYLNSTREIDSIAYSHYLVNKIFNVKTIIPDQVKDLVEERIIEIENFANLA